MNMRPIVRVGLIVVILVVILGFWRLNSAYVMQVDGQDVAILNSIEEGEGALEDLMKIAGDRLQSDVVLKSEISYDKSFSLSSKITPANILKYNLENTVNLDAWLYGLKINDEIVLYDSDKEKLEEALYRVKLHYLGEGEDIYSVEFEENVSITNMGVDFRSIDPEVSNTIEGIVDYLLTGGVEEELYVIQRGDTVSGISSEFDMSIEDIKAANPGINIDRIAEGQELNVSIVRPRLTAK